MLPAAARLSQRSQFAHTIRRGRRLRRGSVLVYATRDSATGNARPSLVGFVVARSVGNAVIRHRVLRRLRHIMRDLLPKLPPGSVTVIRALPESASTPFSRLRDEVTGAVTAVYNLASVERG